MLILGSYLYGKATIDMFPTSTSVFRYLLVWLFCLLGQKLCAQGLFSYMFIFYFFSEIPCCSLVVVFLFVQCLLLLMICCRVKGCSCYYFLVLVLFLVLALVLLYWFCFLFVHVVVLYVFLWNIFPLLFDLHSPL